MALRVEKLDKGRHNIKAFECANAYFTDYLLKNAWKHGQKRMNVCYVAVEDEDEATIRGYMTLSMGHVDQNNLDEWAREGLPRYPIPVLHLGMLATDRRHTGKEVGPKLIVYAMKKALDLSQEVGCHALQLKAAEEPLVAYYEKYGLVRMKEGALLMFIAVATIADAFQNPQGM